jgi:hypothetical protein
MNDLSEEGELMDVFVLTTLTLDSKGTVTSRNVGVTFSLHEAEIHKGEGIENEFETFQIDSNWLEDAASTELVIAMRDFCAMVKTMQEEALR